MTKLISLRQAARILGVSAVTLGRRVRKGEVPGAVRVFGTRWRFRRDRLEAWIAAEEERGRASPKSATPSTSP